MNPVGDLEARRATWLTDRSTCWTRSDGTVVVEEKEKGGIARVRFILPVGRPCIQWHIGGSHLFRILKEESAADGLFMLQTLDDFWEAHIVECKKTVSDQTWKKARQQMRWTLARLRALSGILGFSVSSVVCYTAYREERQSPGRALNSTDFKLGVGVPESSSNASTIPFSFRRQWQDGMIVLEGVEGQLVHRRIELDPVTGFSEYDVTAARETVKGAV